MASQPGPERPIVESDGDAPQDHIPVTREAAEINLDLIPISGRLLHHIKVSGPEELPGWDFTGANICSKCPGFRHAVDHKRRGPSRTRS